MKKVEVFDPPMCCSTGVCGPKVDPALVKFAVDIHWLANQRIAVERYNLAQQPQAFAANTLVKTALQEQGNDCLALILLDGSIISQAGIQPAVNWPALLAFRQMRRRRLLLAPPRRTH